MSEDNERQEPVDDQGPHELENTLSPSVRQVCRSDQTYLDYANHLWNFLERWYATAVEETSTSHGLAAVLDVPQNLAQCFFTEMARRGDRLAFAVSTTEAKVELCDGLTQECPSRRVHQFVSRAEMADPSRRDKYNAWMARGHHLPAILGVKGERWPEEDEFDIYVATLAFFRSLPYRLPTVVTGHLDLAPLHRIEQREIERYQANSASDALAKATEGLAWALGLFGAAVRLLMRASKLDGPEATSERQLSFLDSEVIEVLRTGNVVGDYSNLLDAAFTALAKNPTDVPYDDGQDINRSGHLTLSPEDWPAKHCEELIWALLVRLFPDEANRVLSESEVLAWRHVQFQLRIGPTVGLSPHYCVVLGRPMGLSLPTQMSPFHEKDRVLIVDPVANQMPPGVYQAALPFCAVRSPEAPRLPPLPIHERVQVLTRSSFTARSTRDVSSSKAHMYPPLRRLVQDIAGLCLGGPPLSVLLILPGKLVAAFNHAASAVYNPSLRASSTEAADFRSDASRIDRELHKVVEGESSRLQEALHIAATAGCFRSIRAVPQWTTREYGSHPDADVLVTFDGHIPELDAELQARVLNLKLPKDKDGTPSLGKAWNRCLAAREQARQHARLPLNTTILPRLLVAVGSEGFLAQPPVAEPIQGKTQPWAPVRFTAETPSGPVPSSQSAAAAWIARDMVYRQLGRTANDLNRYASDSQIWRDIGWPEALRPVVKTMARTETSARRLRRIVSRVLQTESESPGEDRPQLLQPAPSPELIVKNPPAVLVVFQRPGCSRPCLVGWTDGRGGVGLSSVGTWLGKPDQRPQDVDFRFVVGDGVEQMGLSRLPQPAPDPSSGDTAPDGWHALEQAAKQMGYSLGAHPLLASGLDASHAERQRAEKAILAIATVLARREHDDTGPTHAR